MKKSASRPSTSFGRGSSTTMGDGHVEDGGGAEAALPPYIWNGQLMAQAPIKMRTYLEMFFLKASLPKLEALCDRYLNLAGSPTHYRPVGSDLAFYCSNLDDQGSLDNPIGVCPERDVGFWVPLIARDADGTERHVVFTPWIWVDDPLAMVGGREVFGFTKELGRLGMPTPKKRSRRAEYTVDTLVLPQYHPEQELVERRLISVRRHGGRWAFLPSLLTNGSQMLRTRESTGRRMASAYLEVVRAALRQKEMRMVFLKQIPDAADPTRACYQAIVEAAVRINGGVSRGVLPGHYQMTITDQASHPIVDTLGLGSQRRKAGESEMWPYFQIWLSFDAVIERGTIVFDSVQQRSGNRAGPEPMESRSRPRPGLGPLPR